MKKIILDREKCMGCGLCANLSPETFGFDGKAVLKGGTETATNIFELATDDASGIEKTASVCPVSAISIL